MRSWQVLSTLRVFTGLLGLFRPNPATGAVKTFPVGTSLDGGPDAALLPVAGGFLETACGDLVGDGGSVFKFVP